MHVCLASLLLSCAFACPSSFCYYLSLLFPSFLLLFPSFLLFSRRCFHGRGFLLPPACTARHQFKIFKGNRCISGRRRYSLLPHAPPPAVRAGVTPALLLGGVGDKVNLFFTRPEFDAALEDEAEALRLTGLIEQRQQQGTQLTAER